MRLIPALTIKDESAVEVVNGQYRPIENSDGEEWLVDDILWHLRDEGYEEAYVLDIDGLERNRPNLPLIQAFCKTLPLWVDAGPFTTTAVMDELVAGASIAVLGSRNIHDQAMLNESLEMSTNIAVSIDYDGRVVSPNDQISSKTPRQHLTDLQVAGVPNIIFFDFGRISRGAPLQIETIRELASDFNNLFVAGVMEQGDLEQLKVAGIAGAIVDFKLLLAWGAKPVKTPTEIEAESVGAEQDE